MIAKKILIITACVFSTQVLSESTTPMPAGGESYMFYDIGNGERKRSPAGGLKYKAPISLEAKFGLGYSCGKFDPKFAIKQTLNNLKNKINAIGAGLQASAAGLPGYALCRSNPLMCQLMEEYTIKAENLVKASIMSCQQIEQAGKEGRDILDSWVKISKSEKLEAISSGGENDITEAIEKIKDHDGSNGITWIGGRKAGGNNQPPIRPIADAVKAGYNMLINRDVLADSKISATDESTAELAAIWDTPEEAAKWVAEVVGETRPDINKNPVQKKSSASSAGSGDGDDGEGGEDVKVPSNFLNSDSAFPGRGLVPKIAKEKKQILGRLEEALDDPDLNIDKLLNIVGKSSKIVITPEVVEAIKSSNSRNLFAEQLAHDAAIESVLHYALTARRTLVAGRNEPHIASYKIGTAELERKLATLEKEIEAAVFARRISGQTLSGTAKRILTMQ